MSGHKDETIREATLDDFEDVLDIEPEAYFGQDYLTYNYPFLIEGHGVKGFVYEKQGKVVGFYSTQLVDGGQTLIGSAGRVKAQYRGQGLYSRFTQRLMEQYCLTSPGIRFETITISNKGMDVFGQRLLNRYEVVMNKNGVSEYWQSIRATLHRSGLSQEEDSRYMPKSLGIIPTGKRGIELRAIAMTTTEVNVAELKCQLDTGQTQPSSDLQPLTDHQLTTMFSQPPSHLHHLFPQQRILLDWHPYRIMASNTDVIKHGNNRIFIAKKEELLSGTKGDHLPITLLSCGSHYPCQRGRSYDVDIFGNGSDEDVRAHIEWHLQRLVKIAEEKVALMTLFCNRDLYSLINSLQAQFPLQPTSLPYKTIFALERDLGRMNTHHT